MLIVDHRPMIDVPLKKNATVSALVYSINKNRAFALNFTQISPHNANPEAGCSAKKGRQKNFAGP